MQRHQPVAAFGPVRPEQQAAGPANRRRPKTPPPIGPSQQPSAPPPRPEQPDGGNPSAAIRRGAAPRPPEINFARLHSLQFGWCGLSTRRSERVGANARHLFRRQLRFKPQPNCWSRQSPDVPAKATRSKDCLQQAGMRARGGHPCQRSCLRRSSRIHPQNRARVPRAASPGRPPEGCFPGAPRARGARPGPSR